MCQPILFFTLGVWLLQQQETLPSLTWGAGIVVFLGAALIYQRKTSWQQAAAPILAAALVCSTGFFYAAFFAQQRLADALPAAWQGKNIQVIGVVAQLPRQHDHGLRFAFDVEKVLTPNATVPTRILLASYEHENRTGFNIHAGERWQFTIRLKQPHGSRNPHDFDFEAWMLENKLRANGYIHPKGNNQRLDTLAYSPGYYIESLREKVRNHILATTAFPSDPHSSLQVRPDTRTMIGDRYDTEENRHYAGVLAALAIGDQASIPAAQWQIFTRTGVNHLMSISGLHITMLSGLGFAAGYWLWRRSARLTRMLPARKAATLAGLLVGLSYCTTGRFRSTGATHGIHANHHCRSLMALAHSRPFPDPGRGFARGIAAGSLGCTFARILALIRRGGADFLRNRTPLTSPALVDDLWACAMGNEHRPHSTLAGNVPADLSGVPNSKCFRHSTGQFRSGPAHPAGSRISYRVATLAGQSGHGPVLFATGVAEPSA